ncbi:helix-turn-helix transcriptional regulator [Leptolyngbya sp. NK1-12]|uniref:Helix-turn-helix transcriptional regulator n=1 Tax=Leptolyngbya sp. NK1-12 TaxID=2547451 RepID=A0AA97ARQ4_9CYAN|nr:AraC family transcriptional regulator [Leptolyngbya sp. NK1-12]WNZ25698.1 helix-turn-helix transcriptional regulator [Leptolyngbya sp. NK1-12]
MAKPSQTAVNPVNPINPITINPINRVVRSSPDEPPSPILSSQALGWEPLLVEEFQQPPGGVDVPEAWPGHSIALCLAPRPHRIHQIVGNRRYTGLYTKGDISITPADIPASYRAEGEDHYLHIQVPAQFLAAVAQTTDLDPERLELVTEFRVRDPRLEQTLLLLRTELHQGSGWAGRLYVESLANLLAVHLLRQYSTLRSRVVLQEGGLGSRQLVQVADYINAHLEQDIKLADLAAVAGISQFHFSRLFKQSLGVAPHQYLLQQRIERAKQLLTTSTLEIAEIALQCGFNSQSHLGKHFRAVTGVTPNSYRRNH